MSRSQSIHPLGGGRPIAPGGQFFINNLFIFFLLNKNNGGTKAPDALMLHTTVVVVPFSALTTRDWDDLKMTKKRYESNMI